MALFADSLVADLVHFRAVSGLHIVRSHLVRIDPGELSLLHTISALTDRIHTTIQECFRFGIYKTLQKAEKGLREVADDSRITENKHILAYVSGLGFGIMSGAFGLVNILADAVSHRPIVIDSHTRFATEK